MPAKVVRSIPHGPYISLVSNTIPTYTPKTLFYSSRAREPEPGRACQESLAKQCYDGGLSYEEKAAKRQDRTA